MSDTPRQRRSAWPLIVSFAVLAVLISLAGYWAWRQQAQSMQRQAERSLVAVGELKANQITTWLNERHGDAEMIRANPLISAAVADMLAGRDVAKAGADLQTVLDAFRRTYGYRELVMTSPEGAVLLRSPRVTSDPLDTVPIVLVKKAAATGRAGSSDLYMDAASHARLDFVAPVPSVQVGGRSIAAVVLRADPGHFLYPLIQAWPLPSRSGESLLVERRGDRVVYLNELRHRKNTAFNLTAPLNAPDLPAAMAVRGRHGVVQGVDYRGVAVLAALQRVPGTSWFLVAKEDTNEILGPIRTRGWLTAGFALLLVILAGAVTAFLWRARESQASAEIRESEERYRALVEHAPMAIFVNREDRVVLANEACLRLFGATLPEQLLSKSPFDLFHPDCHPGMRARIQRLRDEGEEVPQIEEKIVRLDGVVVDVEVAAAPFKDQGVNAIHVVLRDITERKRAEEEIRASERKFKETIESLDEGCYSVTIDGRLLDHNPAYNRIMGVDPDADLRGQRTPDFWWDPADRAAYVEQLSKDGVIRDYLARAKTRDGNPLAVLMSAHLVRDERGEIARIDGSVVDFTARKAAEDEIERLNAELEQRVLDRTAQLDAANKELEAFAYSVSHDLRAPLRHISGFSSLLAERAGDSLDEKSRHCVDTISRSVREMGVLIDDLLEFSRTGRAELKIEPVDMDATLAEALEPLQRETADRDIEWTIGPLPVVVGDHALLRQVWANLLGNAVKYSRDQAPARIEVGAGEGDGANDDVFYVRDNGVGFDMQYAQKLFGVFQRLHSSAEFEGTGIGLANVQRIINRLGGRVWGEAELDKGAAFYFVLPRRKEKPS
jgi:PAS domain S-box-containing protein